MSSLLELLLFKAGGELSVPDGGVSESPVDDVDDPGRRRRLGTERRGPANPGTSIEARMQPVSSSSVEKWPLLDAKATVLMLLTPLACTR